MKRQEDIFTGVSWK